MPSDIPLRRVRVKEAGFRHKEVPVGIDICLSLGTAVFVLSRKCFSV